MCRRKQRGEDMDQQILSALKSIPVSELTRADWIAVGMALKEEGFPCSVWDEWSRNDSRYHAGECEKKWAGFHGSSTPVKAGTIVQMAKNRGWKPAESMNAPMEWNDSIEFDGEPDEEAGSDFSPAKELEEYLTALFLPADHVGYVTGDVYWNDEDQRWFPGRGVFDRTAGELLQSLKRHEEDLGATVGDWKPDAGAWIRFNPMDGKGVKNENVVAFRYALVESDTLPVEEQEILFRKLELPVAAMVYSGGKSIHAIVHIDATDADEYRKRVDFLYQFLEKHGCQIDRQNSNPSRLSRMPGVILEGNDEAWQISLLQLTQRLCQHNVVDQRDVAFQFVIAKGSFISQMPENGHFPALAEN